MSKRILFLNGRLPLPLNVGGDGISMHIILKALSKEGFEIDCHGVINKYFYPNNIPQTIKELSNRRIKFTKNKEENTLQYFNEYSVTIHEKIQVERFLNNYFSRYPNTIIFTQLDLNRPILDWCIKKNAPLLLFIRDTQKNNLLTMNRFKNKQELVHLIFNSDYTMNKFNHIKNYVQTSVVYPPLISEKYQQQIYDPTYITMINPVKVKGGKIFYELAKKLTNIQFLAVKGWYDPLIDKIDFSKLPNVTIWEKKDDVREVYSKTKILLVPSQWEEGFGRVAAEALMFGIPVIASKNAGLTDALGSTGFYVENYTSVTAWENTLNYVLSIPQNTLHNHIVEGKKYAERFEVNRAIKTLISIINNFNY